MEKCEIDKCMKFTQQFVEQNVELEKNLELLKQTVAHLSNVEAKNKEKLVKFQSKYVELTQKLEDLREQVLLYKQKNLELEKNLRPFGKFKGAFFAESVGDETEHENDNEDDNGHEDEDDDDDNNNDNDNDNGNDNDNDENEDEDQHLNMYNDNDNESTPTEFTQSERGNVQTYTHTHTLSQNSDE
ncbi:hypothetical protein RFI_12212 [Reticulomyxa filosa]|uniref:Uncharacterized protein n=1 Tax=Reticulomyxa filosa TaxID=46433 RepID=X6NHX5_RETFI|nr:hypothetical protein RFI_12212 [Reticulomyxa filosa]|eukprot:ETO24937.1 hypothetical protein RFI_12212 [Reticulomyxa filosa]